MRPEIFTDTFIDYLFELVEQTRQMHDESFNYSVIKLIVSHSTTVDENAHVLQVSLNEQFMVASLHPHSPHPNGTSHAVDKQEHKKHDKAEGENRVIRVLMARQGSSMTFGENMIFMLNRAGAHSHGVSRMTST